MSEAYRPKFRAVVTDSDGFVIDPWDAVEHLREHDEGDSACDECPASASVRMGSALPSEPDADGLNSRVPGMWTCADILVEHDDLNYQEADEAALLVEQVVLIANALNHYEASGRMSPSATSTDEPASRPADAKGQEPA